MRRILLSLMVVLLSACSFQGPAPVVLSVPHATVAPVPSATPAPVVLEKAKAAVGGPIVGLDVLGIKSKYWNCDWFMEAINTLPTPIAFGAFLDDTFKDPKQTPAQSEACLKRLLASPKVAIFRGHLAWTKHKTLPASVLIPRAQYFNTLASQFPGVRSYLSHVCEGTYTSSQSSQVFAALRPHSSNVQGYVDSGMTAFDPSAIRECHGPSAVCTAKSLDGQDALDIDSEHFKITGQLYSLIWGRPFNCKFSDKDTREPNRRTDCPTYYEFFHYVRILYPMPPWPAGERLKPNEIWKPSAENYGGCKGRMCKPVAILNTRANQVEITTLSGQHIAWMTNGGSYGKGQTRYYTILTAFQIGQAAEKLSGSEFVILKIGNRRIVVNAYRRGGLMR